MAEIADYVNRGAAQVTPAMVDSILRKLPLWKAEFTQINAPHFPHLVSQLEFLADVVEDTAEGAYKELPYVALAAAVFALVYAHKKVDLIPDSHSAMGRADDSSVVRAVLIQHEKSLARYATAQGAGLGADHQPAMSHATLCLLRPAKTSGATAPGTPAPRPVLSTHEKALQINLDQTTYGTFAEIGAGQEVARWFFRVGGAAGTIAKTMSAYDMKVSDAIYGPCRRYVSRERLQTMLQHEYDLQLERLGGSRGAQTRFFVFADTVAARSYSRAGECHGWLGVRFQTRPLAPASDLIIHVRLLDRENLAQQEALGIMGVNIVYAALYLADQPETALQALLDNLSRDRVEVDMVKVSGPDFAPLDHRLLALQLVARGLTDAAMFTAAGEVVQAAEVLYQRPILVTRGSFRPVTRATVDLLECARSEFLQEPQLQGEKMVELTEMTLHNLAEDGVIDHKDFLDRADILGAMGQTVLISDYGEFYRLAAYLFRYTKKMIGLAMGVPTLRELFEERYYLDLEGGILESFGRLFKNDLKLYVYPYLDPATGRLEQASDLRVAGHLRHLFAFLMENGCIRPLIGYAADCLPIFSHDVLAKLRAGDPAWERLVPERVAQLIRERRLFGYAG